MPFLRVVRDKRGYETTYLMHWYRDGNRQRSRILYVFRTPGAMRVGREALEPDVLRDIESQHPGIAFDWKAVVANRQVVESAPEPRRPRKRRRPDEGAVVETPGPGAPGAPAAGVSDRAPAAAPARPSVPSAVQGATPDEQIAFLNQWYPIVRDRILQRMSNPARRDALLALAERLNPAAWTDADEIAAGLERATEALARLSRVFSRRRRRPRRSSTGSAGSPPPEPAPSDS